MELGLPKDMVNRHPFFRVRSRCTVLGEIHKSMPICCDGQTPFHRGTTPQMSFYDKVSQAFAVFLPVRSVASWAMGDAMIT